MTVDARCLIATDLGIAKDGSGLSEDHAQGLGLITYRGTFIFDGILTPARGRVIQVAYARPQYGSSGLLTRFYPRLQVISSSADPFANETTVEVGCQLELMRDRRDAIQYRAIDHPPAWWTALSPARQKEVPPVVEVQGVIEFCLAALGIPLAAGSATTSDVKVAEAIDLSGGYVQALDDMLRSSLLIGHITPAGELLVQPVDLTPAPGPVLRRRNLLTLRPINDRGGAEQVIVEFDAIEAPSNLTPEQLTEEERQLRDWEYERTISPPTTFEIFVRGRRFRVGVGSEPIEPSEPIRVEVEAIQTAETFTTYRTFEWRDEDGTLQKQDLAVRRVSRNRSSLKQTLLLQIILDTSKYVMQPSGNIPHDTDQITEYEYIIEPGGPRLSKEVTRDFHSKAKFVTALPIVNYDYEPDFAALPFDSVEVARAEVVNEVDEAAGLTKRKTTRWAASGKTQNGSVAAAIGSDDMASADDFNTVVRAAQPMVCLGTEVQIGVGRQFGLQSRPSAQARLRSSQLSRFRDDPSLTSSGTVGSSIGQEEPQVVTAGYRFGGAGTDQWNTSNLRLPYAPDDFITASGTVDLLLTRGRARERALEYGRIQNALDFGHANGVEVTTAAWELPSPPLAAVYIEESGVSTAFRVNGRSWEIRNGAIIVSADLCLVGSAGRIIGETPISWTPLPSAASALPGLGAPSGSGELLPANTITLPGGFNPAAPGTVWSSLPTNGTDTYGPSRSPGSIAPPYVQTVQTLARSRALAITTELLYSLVPITEGIEAVSRAVAGTVEVAYVGAPRAAFRLVPQVPEVYAPVRVAMPRADLRLTPQVPTVSGAAYVRAPRADLRIVPRVPNVGAQGLVVAPRADFRLVPRVPTVTATATDPDFSSVSLLLLGNGTDGSTTITDSSPVGLTMTAEGNAQISTAQAKFGSSSISFDGSGDRVSTPDNSALDFADNEAFTLECFFRSAVDPTTYSAQLAYLFGKGNGAAGSTYSVNLYLGKAYFAYNGSALSLDGTTTIAANQWYHVAVTRTGAGVMRLFVDGIEEDTTTDASAINGTASFNVGDRQAGDPGGQYPFNGHIEQVRVTKGVARYTSDFTPTTAPFPTS